MKIAFTGKLQSGKTTAAEYLKRRFGYQIFKFAQGVRDISDIIMEGSNNNYITSNILDYAKLKTEHYDDVLAIVADIRGRLKDADRRTILQEVGTNGFRKNLHDSFWVELMARNPKFIRSIEDGYNVTIDDLRFVNEADFCKELGMYVIKVQVEPEVQIQRIKEKRKMDSKEDSVNHDSEKEVDEIKYDFFLDGNGTLENFYQQIEELIPQLKEEI